MSDNASWFSALSRQYTRIEEHVSIVFENIYDLCIHVRTIFSILFFILQTTIWLTYCLGTTDNNNAM